MRPRTLVLSFPCSFPCALPCTLILALASGGLRAAPPSIRSISPRGAERGREVVLVVEGSGLAGDAELITRLSSVWVLVTDDEKLKPTPERVAFRLGLNASEAPGPSPLRVRTKEGLSNPVLFTVGDLPEVGEVEPNETPPEAKAVPVPSTVNGRLGATDRDTFRFPAAKGERLVFEVEARRLGSGVDPTLHLLRADGREIGLAEDSYGLDVDARIDHTFAEAGEYLVQVHDTVYLARNPDFYRLKIGSLPYAESVFPLGGRAGSEVQVVLEGGNLPSPLATRVSLDPDPLETWTRISMPLASGGSLPFRFKIGTLPEAFEAPRGKPDSVQPILPSTTINGRIDAPGEVDRYSLDVAAGGRWVQAIEAASLGSWLDAVVSILGEDGKQIASADDDGTSPDPRIEFAVPDGAKRVIIRVEDLHRRGGKAFGYRLTASPQTADFGLRLATPQVNLPLKGTAMIEVECVRRGYGGPVRLSISPEPVGFTVRGGDILPDQEKGYLTITGPDAGGLRYLELAVRGTGGTALEPLVRRAQGTIFLAADEAQPVSPLSVAAVYCAVSEPPPLSLRPAVDTVEVVVGHSMNIAIEAARREGVAGEIQLKGISAPPGLTVGEGKIPAGQAGGQVALTAAPGAALREGDVIIVGSTKAQNADLAAPAPVIRARVVRPFSVELTRNAVQMPAGGKTTLEGKILRKAPFSGKVDGKVEGLPSGMTSSPLEVAPDKADFQVELAVPATQPPGMVSLSIVLSTGLGDPKKPVLHALPSIPVAVTITAPEAAGSPAAPPSPAPASAPPPAKT